VAVLQERDAVAQAKVAALERAQGQHESHIGAVKEQEEAARREADTARSKVCPAPPHAAPRRRMMPHDAP